MARNRNIASMLAVYSDSEEATIGRSQQLRNRLEARRAARDLKKVARLVGQVGCQDTRGSGITITTSDEEPGGFCLDFRQTGPYDTTTHCTISYYCDQKPASFRVTARSESDTTSEDIGVFFYPPNGNETAQIPRVVLDLIHATRNQLQTVVAYKGVVPATK